jgi:hypothetical protein
MKFLKWFFGLFSPYVSPFERKVDKFFVNIKSTDSLASIKDKLLELMQENLMIVNVWLEKKFKGYLYLTKDARRQMYADTQLIIKKLEEFCAAHPVKVDDLKIFFKQQSFPFPDGSEDKLVYLYQIMMFLEPEKYYHYITTASFGKLLRDPNKVKLEGDCNQIVTLYIYLYSLKYPVTDLQIKLLPEHVCLHFREIDIECTNGQFAKYTENREVLPSTEIISTNLLDLSDFREDIQTVTPDVIVKSAQLAYAISSLKTMVAKNLNIAYHNLAVSALNSHKFDSAIFYFEKAGDREQMINVYRNGAIYYFGLKDYKKALFYANKSGDHELEKNIKYSHGVELYNNNSVDRALEIFSSLGDEKMKKACYQKQYNELVHEVAGVKTIQEAKNKKFVYQKMLTLAEKMGDESSAASVRGTLGKI